MTLDKRKEVIELASEFGVECTPVSVYVGGTLVSESAVQFQNIEDGIALAQLCQVAPIYYLEGIPPGGTAIW